MRPHHAHVPILRPHVEQFGFGRHDSRFATGARSIHYSLARVRAQSHRLRSHDGTMEGNCQRRSRQATLGLFRFCLPRICQRRCRTRCHGLAVFLGATGHSLAARSILCQKLWLVRRTLRYPVGQVPFARRTGSRAVATQIDHSTHVLVATTPRKFHCQDRLERCGFDGTIPRRMRPHGATDWGYANTTRRGIVQGRVEARLVPRDESNRHVCLYRHVGPNVR
mmetsp:Transcript_5590/g.12304  ORF Transcript_5590/g.12304 Transcript_5590/m.12304 type:complete len:223 (-) Transcript_5590:241-909(-)